MKVRSAQNIHFFKTEQILTICWIGPVILEKNVNFHPLYFFIAERDTRSLYVLNRVVG